MDQSCIGPLSYWSVEALKDAQPQSVARPPRSLGGFGARHLGSSPLLKLLFLNHGASV